MFLICHFIIFVLSRYPAQTTHSQPMSKAMATPDAQPHGDQVVPTLVTLVDDFANITDINNATIRELPIVSKNVQYEWVK